MSGLPAGLEDLMAKAAPLAERFTAAGHRFYFVGGVVRDHLLARSRTAQDLDATTDARPDEIKAVVADVAEAVWTQGERFGTIGCTVDGQIYEITTHRAEHYEAGSRKPAVSFGDRIEDDLARRDFTVNAMAVDLADGSLVDPHGGRADLAAGVLRTPLDPVVSFSEDPLRMLRAARFRAGYSLVPTPELTDAIATLLDRMAIVSIERIRDELQKLLLLEDPADGFRLLAETDLFGRVLPMLGPQHPDAAASSGRLAAAVAPDPAARWAALLAPASVAARELAGLKFSGTLARDVVWFASFSEWAETPGSRSASAPRVRRDAAMVPAGRALAEALDWVAATRSVKGLVTDDVEEYRDALVQLQDAEPDLADPSSLLAGEEVCAVLGIAPGPEVGVAMSWLRELRFDEGPMAPDVAAERLRRWWPTRESASG